MDGGEEYREEACKSDENEEEDDEDISIVQWNQNANLPIITEW